MKRETILNINGEDYPTSIEYRNVRYIRYKLENGKIMVVCPYFVTLDYLKKVISRTDFKKKNKELEPAFTTEYCYIYGEKQKIDNCFVNVDSHFVLFNKDTFYKDINKYFYKYVDERLYYYEKLMNIDKHYDLTIRYVSTRYGSNSKRTHHITINAYLIHFSKDIIDAIIVHELAHNFYYDHSKNFYNFVYEYCPNYKALHKCLRVSKYQGVNK